MASGLDSVGVALQTLRSKPLNTLLSTLGIVVGIAALVGILSFADGMERFAREQVMRNTDFHSIMVNTQTTKQVDGIRIRRDFPVVSFSDIRALRDVLGDTAEVTLVRRHGAIVSLVDGTSDDAGTQIFAGLPNVLAMGDGSMLAGRFLSDEDVDEAANVVVVSDSLAKRLMPGQPAASIVGQRVLVGVDTATVIGVLSEDVGSSPLSAHVPVTSFLSLNPGGNPPIVAASAERIEDVPRAAESMRAWFDGRFGDEADALQIATNASLVDQVSRGILLFKIIMGLIVGLSVMVGGIGVMNVLLMSVTERTREIGIRKATGARRKDIVSQFLIESIGITALGCLIGLAFGGAVVMVATPIIRTFAEVPFDAVLSGGTVVVVATAAIILGLTFGTYPAWRAAQLSPVDAIRHE